MDEGPGNLGAEACVITISGRILRFPITPQHMEAEKDISFKIQVLHTRAAELLKAGHSDEHIIDELSKSDITRAYAQTILENVYTDKSLKKQGRNLLIMGLFTTIGGLIVNLLSYRAAAESGSGSFLLLWGIVIAGILMIVKAVGVYRRTGQ